MSQICSHFLGNFYGSVSVTFAKGSFCSTYKIAKSQRSHIALPAKHLMDENDITGRVENIRFLVSIESSF